MKPVNVFFHLCRLTLAGLFLWAGWLKALDPGAFAAQVAAYQLLPYAWNYLVAATLPYGELLAGALLLANCRVRPAALLLGGLTVIFMGALGSLLLRGLEIDCGCFGSAAGSSAWAALARDAGILLLAHFTFHLSPSRLRS